MYIVESDFYYRDYRCVTIFGDMGFRCGYVGVSKEHPLYRKDYSDTVDIPYSNIENEPIGKRGIMPVLFAGYRNGDEASLDVYFDVHGSLTYSGGGNGSTYPVESDLWWLGFDCGHYGDALDLALMKKLWGDDERIKFRIDNAFVFEDYEIRTPEYVQQECKNLVDQIIEYVDKIKEVEK